MSQQEPTQIPAISRLSRRKIVLIVLGCFALLLGLGAISFPLLFLILICIGLPMLVLGPLYALASLAVLPLFRRSFKPGGELAQQQELTLAEVRAAHFVSPIQQVALAFNLTLACLLMLMTGGISVWVIIPTPASNAPSTVSTAAFWLGITAMSVVLLISIPAMIVISSWHYRPSLVRGEYHALITKSGAHRLIRFARRLDLAVLIGYPVIVLGTLMLSSFGAGS